MSHMPNDTEQEDQRRNGEELRAHYQFDYSQARPNRFARHPGHASRERQGQEGMKDNNHTAPIGFESDLWRAADALRSNMGGAL